MGARVLATVLAGRGGHRQALQALEILGLSDRPGADDRPGEDSAPPEDLRTRATILALQPSRARRREATAILDRLIDRGLSRPEDLALLARLHESDGDWPKARRLLQELLARREGDSEVLASYIRALLRHGQVDEASLALAKLEALAPKAPATVEIQARVFHAGRRDQQATELLERFASEDDARLEAVARLCEELGQQGAAERLFRLSMERHSSRRPESALVLAGFLGRRGSRRRGLRPARLPRAWNMLPAPQVSSAALAILYGSSNRDTPQFERLGRRLEKLLRDDPRR